MENTKKTNMKFNILAIIAIIVMAFAVSPKTLQNDTYYTIKIGEYILENGITMQDPFSWHGISYTFPHWAYDVMIYLIYSIGGHLGVYISTIVFSIILGIIVYLMNDKFTKNKPISFILTIATLYLLKDFLSSRAQLFTFILFALELLFIESFLESGKKRYIVGLIIIPILLANFHVAVFPFYFVIFLPYIAEYIIVVVFDVKTNLAKRIERLNSKLENCKNEIKAEKLKNKVLKLQESLTRKQSYPKKEPYKIRITKRNNTSILIIIMIICIFTGLLTPLGDVPYTYLVKTMKGNSTQNISEHLPLTLAQDTNLVAVFAFFIAIIMFTDTKIRLCDLFMLGGMTFLTFMSRRQESLFFIMCIPIFNRMVTAFFNKYDKGGIEKMTKAMTSIYGMVVSFSLVLILSMVLYGNKYKSSYVSESSYPVKASEWILENLDINNIKLYNEYNYGSYLLFKGIPVFLDSRCDLYMPEFNKDVNVFNDFLNISNLNFRDLESKFNEYGFTHFITKSDAKILIYFEAKPDNYKKLYSDDNFVIYERVV